MVSSRPPAPDQGDAVGVAGTRDDNTSLFQRAPANMADGAAVSRLTTGQEQGCLGQSIAGVKGSVPEPAPCECRREGGQGRLANRLRTIERHPPTAQVERSSLI